LRDRIIRQEAHFDFIVETAAKLGLSDEELEEDLAVALEISGKVPKGRKVEATRPHTSPVRETEPAIHTSTKSSSAKSQSPLKGQSSYYYEEDNPVDYEEDWEDDLQEHSFQTSERPRPQPSEGDEAKRGEVQPSPSADTRSVSSLKSSTYSTHEGDRNKARDYPFFIDRTLPTEVGVTVSPLVVSSRGELCHLIRFLDDLQLKRRVAGELEQRWKGRTDSRVKTSIKRYQHYLSCEQLDRAQQISDEVDAEVQRTLRLDGERFRTVLPVNHPKFLFKEAS
jgi:hypothetical protein